MVANRLRLRCPTDIEEIFESGRQTSEDDTLLAASLPVLPPPLKKTGSIFSSIGCRQLVSGKKERITQSKTLTIDSLFDSVTDAELSKVVAMRNRPARIAPDGRRKQQVRPSLILAESSIAAHVCARANKTLIHAPQRPNTPGHDFTSPEATVDSSESSPFPVRSIANSSPRNGMELLDDEDSSRRGRPGSRARSKSPSRSSANGSPMVLLTADNPNYMSSDLSPDMRQISHPSAFTVNRDSQTVQFQTLRPGDNSKTLFPSSTSSTNPAALRKQRTRRLKSDKKLFESKRTKISFTGPGFAPLPNSKGSESTATEETAPRMFRRATMADVTDSMRSEKTRDYSVLFDEHHLTGMFKSKRDVKRRLRPSRTLVPSGGVRDGNLLAEASPAVQRDFMTFYWARKAADVPQLLTLLDSQLPLPDNLSRHIHPWVEAPESVCALAVNQIAIIAAQNPLTPEDTAVSTVLKLIPLLSAPETDKSEAALLALGLITAEVPSLAQLLFEHDALPILINMMFREKEGVKATAAQLCRNVYVLDLTHRRAFRDLGGIRALLALTDHGSVDLQIEAIYHIGDFIMQNGEELPEFVDAVKVMSAGAKLELLLEYPDEYLYSVVKQLYLRLAD
ncbi:putative ARM repeat protein [Gregarina niphandrodes]|uniref:ARM repeat protein n=1 Tax=Gregarina niphandrodes TaxID=110365 RepID=A0A023B937_GRENI|nr:putative ARM repeat protein [Gregarina niphandrodes]EZG71253.1 putative ARM repeat protein [Gregarina niphandrodes]|eukprot:XP_011129836.1 putative ARM repeat protein [Gregarina niphandrodes]